MQANIKNSKIRELNEEMANYTNALIAFCDGKSRGTKHMIEMAKQFKLRKIILVIKLNH